VGLNLKTEPEGVPSTGNGGVVRVIALDGVKVLNDASELTKSKSNVKS